MTASEIMAILALAHDLDDLRARISRIVVGTSRSGDPVSVSDLGLTGPLMAVMRHTIMPNLVQTMEGQPALVHSGPFGNIAHGCSSIIADRLALGYADIIITEAGFASDLGFEKFMHIKTRQSGLPVAAAVLVSLSPCPALARRRAPPQPGPAQLGRDEGRLLQPRPSHQHRAQLRPSRRRRPQPLRG